MQKNLARSTLNEVLGQFETGAPIPGVNPNNQARQCAHAKSSAKGSNLKAGEDFKRFQPPGLRQGV